MSKNSKKVQYVTNIIIEENENNKYINMTSLENFTFKGNVGR